MQDFEAFKSEPTQVSQDLPTLKGCLKVSLKVGGVLLLLFLLHAVWIIVPNLYNRVKWQQQGSPKYIVTIGLTSTQYIAGESTITVENGEIVAATRYSNTYSSSDIDSRVKWFRGLTIESLFDRVYGCALMFPLLSCSYEYDPQLGYPRKLNIDCPISDACLDYYAVRDLKLQPK